MSLRQSNLQELASKEFDVLILGGGINGAAAAAALSARGAKVALVDKGDFASQTSSNSSNLAWGGIKYLESHEYALVNKLCNSRNKLLRSYPSTVKEIRFLTSIQRGFRLSPLLVFLGTVLYWLIGRRLTAKPRFLTRKKIRQWAPTVNIAKVQAGVEYSDAYLYDNDARFVFNFVRKAMDHNAVAVNYVQASQSLQQQGIWSTRVKDMESGEKMLVRSKMVINACGPLTDSYNGNSGQHSQFRHLFSKGVHLVVDRLPQISKVLAFFASDGRLFFVIPLGSKTCIGTTDELQDSPVAKVTEQDRQFILDNVNQFLSLPKPLTQADIISERCGVRPLAVKNATDIGDDLASDKKNKAKLSRRHQIDVNWQDRYISIFGGKLTDCLNVGEEVCQIYQRLGLPLASANAPWYGESTAKVKQAFMHKAKLAQLDALTSPLSQEPLSQRLWRRYDRHALQILDEIQRDPAQGEQLIEHSQFIRAELHYAARREMVTKLEDFLRRRSKIEMVLRQADFIHCAGLEEACRILFGQDAEAKLAEYKRKQGILVTGCAAQTA